MLFPRQDTHTLRVLESREATSATEDTASGRAAFRRHSRRFVEPSSKGLTWPTAPYTGRVAKPALSDAIQDYLKELYHLQTGGGRVSVTALAREQRVSPASASAMVKKLAALELVEHAPYRGVRLTPAGEKVAVEVIRHHRLLELYLARTLGLDVEDVHDEAERLEHALSEELEARIDSALGFPTHDPHGDPIPNADLEWPK
jgi:DtxR family transcriptional regulator, Mn-dependent transcriptional regulator